MKLISLTKFGYAIVVMTVVSFISVVIILMTPPQQTKIVQNTKEYVVPQNILSGAERCREEGGTPRTGMCFKNGVVVDIFD